MVYSPTQLGQAGFQHVANRSVWPPSSTIVVDLLFLRLWDHDVSEHDVTYILKVADVAAAVGSRRFGTSCNFYFESRRV
jgi:hypothetical protein